MKKEAFTPFHFQRIAHRGACGKTRVVPHNRRPRQDLRRKRGTKLRVVLSTYGSGGDVEPMVALAVRSRALGVEARMCAPPDQESADLPAGAGVPRVPVGRAQGGPDPR